MSRETISVVRVQKKPDYQKTAAELLERCRAFFQDEENEKDFQAWKAEQKKKGA